MAESGDSSINETGQDVPPKKKPRAKAADSGVKTRCIISTEPDHPFSHFLNELKDRGIKGFDPGDFLKEILDTLPEDFWEKKLEDLTPLEYKINAALADPKMREKLTVLLAAENQIQ